MVPISKRKKQLQITVSQKENPSEYLTQYRKIMVDRIEDMFGSLCFLCGTKKRKLVKHNIKGRPHKGYISPKLIKEFRSLCYRCHAILHVIFRDMDINKLLKLLKELENSDYIKKERI